MLPLAGLGAVIKDLVAKVNEIVTALSLQNATNGVVATPIDTYGEGRTFYVDGAYTGNEDSNHFATAASCMTAIGALKVAASAAKPVRVFSGLKSDGTLVDWSAYDLTAQATAGVIIHVFNEGVV